MTIEQLIGLATTELEALANNPKELEKHFGWTKEICRPDSIIVRERVAKGSKPISKEKVEKVKQANALDSAREFARKEAARLGIKLEI